MDSYKETFDTWNKVHQQYQEKFMDLSIYNESYDMFCSLLDKPNPHVLDIGCGPGNISAYLNQQIDDIQLFGIDYSPNMIALAKRNNPKGTFQVLDAQQIERIERQFHGIISGFLIPYLSKAHLDIFIQNIYAKLLDKGICYLSFVEGDYQNSGYQVSKAGDQVYFHYYSIKDIQEMLIKHGFSMLHEYSLPYPKPDQSEQKHVLVIARKD